MGRRLEPAAVQDCGRFGGVCGQGFSPGLTEPFGVLAATGGPHSDQPVGQQVLPELISAG